MNSWVIGLRPINVNYNKKEKLLLNRQELQRKVRQIVHQLISGKRLCLPTGFVLEEKMFSLKLVEEWGSIPRAGSDEMMHAVVSYDTLKVTMLF
jgi:hypothetical protein